MNPNIRYISPFSGSWWRGTQYSMLIIYANLILWFVFFLSSNIRGIHLGEFVNRYLAISPAFTIQHFYFWTLVTYAFVHIDIWHVFFNMLLVLFFGPRIERDMGRRRFITFYFLCAIGGALVSILAKTLLNVPNPTIGASGAVLGVMVAYGMLYPRDRIYIWGILPVSAWTLVIGTVVLQFLFIIQSGAGSQTDYWAHIGGLATGFAYMYSWFNSMHRGGGPRIRIANWRGEESGDERSYYLEK